MHLRFSKSMLNGDNARLQLKGREIVVMSNLSTILFFFLGTLTTNLIVATPHYHYERYSVCSFTHHTRVKNNDAFLLGASLRRKTLLKYSNLSEEDKSNVNRWTSNWFDANFFPSSFSKNNQVRKEGRSTHVDDKFTNQTEIKKGPKNDDKPFSYMQQQHQVKKNRNDEIDTMKLVEEKGEKKGRHHKAQKWTNRKFKKEQYHESEINEDIVLDMAVSSLNSSRDLLLKDIEILPSAAPIVVTEFCRRKGRDRSPKEASIFRRLKNRIHHIIDWKKSEADSSLLLSNPEHNHRIEDDINRLAISIASNVDSPWQWQSFCTEGGGLVPLLKCIRDSAREIEKLGFGVDIYEFDRDLGMLGLAKKHEDAFSAACLACKTLRNLCSIDADWCAVITDEILREDTSLVTGEDNDGLVDPSAGVISDLSIILRYINYNDDKHFTQQSRTKKVQYSQSNKSNDKNHIHRMSRRDARRRCGLYIIQLLLAMSLASDDAVNRLRLSQELIDTAIRYSSFPLKEELNRKYLLYPIEGWKRIMSCVKKQKLERTQQPIFATSSMSSLHDELSYNMKKSANQLLAALGCNMWTPKLPGQKGLRILCLDGGGSRGIAAIAIIRSIVDAMGGLEICDSFDMIAGTSTGAIIAFLIGLKRESSEQAWKRYDKLIEKIFVKSALRTPMLLLTTASYSEAPFKAIMDEILGDQSMLDSRSDPRVPLCFAISTKMSSTTTQLSIFRNYNYSSGQKNDTFVIDPMEARKRLGFDYQDKFINPIISDKLQLQVPSRQSDTKIREGSRHGGSFRILQKAALRATTAAPTVFKPVLMGDELYCDGGIVATNPAAIAIHEARSVFPEIPIDMIVSCGTGEFVEEKTSPKIGWDGILQQIIKSATDAGKTHHVLEDVLGAHNSNICDSHVSNTRYYRFNPIIGSDGDFPIDETDPERLKKLYEITKEYMNLPEQTQKLKEISGTTQECSQNL